MTLFPLVCALLLEQLRPWSEAVVRRCALRMADLAQRRLDDGTRRSGMIAWCVITVAGVSLTYALYAICYNTHAVFAILFSTAMLYLALGFRHETAPFSEIHLALSTGDNEGARQRLTEWGDIDCARASSSETARIATELLLVRTHRRLFGPILWFVVLPGPTGVIFYRLAETVAERWCARDDLEASPLFAEFAVRAFQWIEWLPTRLTALSYSVMGNFEDAIYCWRSQSVLWPDKASGILIASGAGALGVRLGLPIHTSHTVIDRPEMGVGHKADTEHMQGAAKLVWRVLFMWLLLLALLGLAGILGR